MRAEVNHSRGSSISSGSCAYAVYSCAAAAAAAAPSCAEMRGKPGGGGVSDFLDKIGRAVGSSTNTLQKKKKKLSSTRSDLLSFS